MIKQSEQAQIVAFQAAAFIVSDEELLGMFLNQSGASSDDFAALLQEKGFLASLLGFLLETDERVIDFCNQCNLKPQELQQYYYNLAGEHMVS